MSQTSLQLVTVNAAPTLPFRVFCGMYDVCAETASAALRELTALVEHHQGFGLPIGACHIIDGERLLLSFVEEDS